jgi:hypothetical protein
MDKKETSGSRFIENKNENDGQKSVENVVRQSRKTPKWTWSSRTILPSASRESVCTRQSPALRESGPEASPCPVPGG